MSDPIEVTPDTFEPWQLDPVIDELLGSEALARDGKAARTLVKGEGLTVVLTVMRAGGQLHEHRAPATVLVVPLRGEVVFEHGDRSTIVSTTGTRVLAMGPGQRHAVQAHRDSAFLLVIGPRS
jgi:quercetin dioxygenase-like cupin family protein